MHKFWRSGTGVGTKGGVWTSGGKRGRRVAALSWSDRFHRGVMSTHRRTGTDYTPLDIDVMEKLYETWSSIDRRGSNHTVLEGALSKDARPE